MEGYRSVLKRIYSCEAYYERVKLYLNRTQPRAGERTYQAALADRGQCARLCHFDRPPGSLWPAALELLEVSARRRRRAIATAFGAAMTLAVMGYHFQVMTRRLIGDGDSPVLTPEMEKLMSAEPGGPQQHD